jgi:hypothetical protein
MTKPHSRRLLYGVILLFLLLLLAAAAWFLLQARNQPTRAFVQIQSPGSGILTDINASLPLVAYAEASRPVLRLELYADGALVAAVNGDSHALTLAESWAPLSTGRHALLARAFFAANDFADSPLVFVDTADLSGIPVQVSVDELPRGEGVDRVTVGDLAEAAGTSPEELAFLNPDLPTDPSASIPPGTLLNLPKRQFYEGGELPVIPPPAPGAPGTPADPGTSPRFEGETHSCSQITMRWSRGEFEAGYRIYRLAPGEDLMVLMATLPVTDSSYTDSPITRIGTYRYFLAPIRPGGEGIASMLSVEIGPECSPAGTGATTSLSLLMLNLTTQETFDGVYCYVSINGSRYERLPGDPGVLRPTSGDLNYDLPLQLPSRGRYGLTVPTDGLVRLDGECWGRRGAESVRIGDFTGSHARPEWDGRDLTAELLAYRPGRVASTDGLPLQSGGASFLRYRIATAGLRFDLSQIAPGALQSIYLNVPAILDPLEGNDTQIPPPTNLRIRNVAGCDILPTTDPNIASSVCTGPLMPMLRWDWAGNAFYGEDDVVGWQINTWIVMDDLRPGALSTPGPSLLVVRPLGATSAGRSAGLPVFPSNIACGGNIGLRVTTLTARGNSLPSEPIYFQQPRCPDLGLVRITVNAITVGPSTRTGELRDDGDICILCADRRMEVFGDLFIGVHDAAPTFDNPPSHGAGTTLFGTCPNNTACLTAGRYQWLSGPHIAPWLSEMDIQAASLGRNGEITFTVVLQDYDTNNGPDNYCVATQTLQPRSNAEWTRLNETIILRGSSGEASCEVEILVRGIPSINAP